MTLDEAVIATLSYSNYFSAPLTQDELHLRLVEVKVTRKDLEACLSKLQETGEVQVTGDYYHLPGQSRLVSMHLKRRALAKIKLQKIRSQVKPITHLPGALAIYATGSVAAGSAKDSDDLDVMIIAKNDMLWTARFFTTLTTELLGLRRRPGGGSSKDKLCLNLYLTPRALSIPKSKRSLYTAYELIQAKPVFDPHFTHAALLSANPWISKFLPNFPLPDSPSSRHAPQSQLTKAINRALFRLQYLYMRKKLTREHVTLDSAFFHPKNPSPPALFTIASISPVAASLRGQGKKIVLATGFFDLLHGEHIQFLQKARSVGDILIVAVESDERARKLKGEGRPVETQLTRAHNILARGLADYVITLGDDFDNPKAYESLMATLKPSFYAVSSHTSYQELKQKLARKHGGKLIVVHDFNPKVSTTKIIEKGILSS